MPERDVLIIGAGLAGLCCAKRLAEAGISFSILEASDEVGGRARTDIVDGFQLDRGFQVLLTAYPEAERILDYDRLQLGRFEPGAIVRMNGTFERIVDPKRRPSQIISAAFSPVAGFGDKLKLAQLTSNVSSDSLDNLYRRPQSTTLERLQSRGFSAEIIDRFFRPFLGGIFLEDELNTSSRMFDFVFRMFATGDAALPEKGMGEMARQIASSLPQSCIRKETRVKNVSSSEVQLETGETLTAKSVVVATEAPAADALLGEDSTSAGNGVTCVYFSADESPVSEPILVLNGEGKGIINNLCVPSDVCAGYAPEGKSLVSVSVIGTKNAGQEASILPEVMAELQQWYGAQVDSWQHLKTYSIPYALPSQASPALDPVVRPSEREDGIFVCGDYLDTASIHGAMMSGRRAAEAIINSA
ncbi:MAG: NAD(P)/FAD-dependent oxidoreductase [Planctomycetota bacterium]